MEIKEGYILWLKKYDHTNPMHREYFLGDKDMHDHPVVVVRARGDSKEVHICLMTSRPTAGFYNYNLAVYPHRSPDPDVAQLRLLNDVPLGKDEGYVNARRSYLVHRTTLNSFYLGEESDYCCLTGESLAIVRRSIGDPLPADVQLRHLDQGDKVRSLETKLATLNKVEAENESLRPVQAEVIGLRQIEGEATRLSRLYPEEVGLQTLMNFIDWNHRVQGSEPAVGKKMLAISENTQSSAEEPPPKPTTEPTAAQTIQEVQDSEPDSAERSCLQS